MIETATAEQGRLDRYAEHKDSGIDWLGEIPAHWEPIRLRFRLQVSPSKSELEEREDIQADSEVTFLPMEAIGEEGDLDLSETKALEDVADGYTYFRDGDVLVAKITPCFENGKGALAEGLEGGIGFGTTELHVLRPGAELDKCFLFYITRTHPFRKIGEAWMYGAGGQKRVPDDFIRNLRWPVPSLEEQRAIAAYLDRETKRIDTLVAKKERLIELLEEKRTALISRIVTRGLDPDVELKDSGVEWLGQIPRSWEVRKVKYSSTVRRGKFTHRPRNDPKLYNGNHPFIQTGDVAAAGKYITEHQQSLNDEGLSVSEKFPTGTLVMTIAANIGDLAILNFDACFPDSIVSLYPFDGVAKDYLYYALIAMKAELQRTSVENTQLNLNVERIGNTSIAIPPLAEQQEIADYLDQQTAKIDALVAKVEEGIERLKEYRTALISTAVAGQIDVREAVEERGEPVMSSVPEG